MVSDIHHNSAGISMKCVQSHNEILFGFKHSNGIDFLYYYYYYQCLFHSLIIPIISYSLRLSLISFFFIYISVKVCFVTKCSKDESD